MTHANWIMNRMKTGITLIVMAWLMTGAGTTLSGQPFVTKKGGICFRIDNNPELSKLHQVESLFSSHGFPFSMAVTSWVFPIAPQYIDTLISYSQRGYEIMDNTPSYHTQYMNLVDIADTTLFSGNPGVDHFYQNRVCLRYAAVDTFQNHNEGKVNVTGNRIISQSPGEFSDLTGNPYFFALYLNTINKVFLWYDLSAVDPSTPDTLYIQSFWEEPVTESYSFSGLRYHKLTQQNVLMMPEAMLLLGERSQSLFNQYGLPAPKTWIHPDGQMPFFSGYQIKNHFGDSLDYLGASNYINESFMCFNEYNPQGMSQFGMQNDQISLARHSFASTKAIVADWIAKHYVKFDITTLQGVSGGWDNYLLRLDSLLSWCNLYDIPVGTYSQWRNWLYDSIPLRITNVFPLLQVDYNENNYPDGYDQLPGITGFYDTTDGVAESGNCSFSLGEAGTFCQVTHLTGLEKGKNFLDIWTRRTNQDTLPAMIHLECIFPENGMITAFDLSTDSLFWTKQTVFVTVPDSITLMNVSITRTDTLADTLKISGMNFRSAGFLNRSAYPHQEVMQYEQFSSIDLYDLVISSLYDPASIIWWIKDAAPMQFSFTSPSMLLPMKPASFWVGSDTSWLMAQSPDGILDSCRLTFRSLLFPGSCPGIPLTISILDTIENGFISWTSVPYDPTISDSTVFNPTVNPLVTTLYKVKVTNPIGPVYYDSLRVIKFPVPDSILPPDINICGGDSVRLIAVGGVSYLWSTGATSSSIVVSPPETTSYWVLAENVYGCSGYDTVSVIVRPRPGVNIVGLWPAYCVYDYSSSVFGNPPGGILSGPGITGDIFYPDSANLGSNQITYMYTDPYGCSNADTVIVWIYPRPSINPQPEDTTVCADKSITLHAGGGNSSYLWSNGVADSIITVDTTGIGLGDYRIWVYVTENGCVNMDTAYITFITCPIGVDDPEVKSGFVIFPNPASSMVTIAPLSTPAEPFSTEIFTMSGMVIFTFEERMESLTFSVAAIPSGTYFVRIHSQGTHFLARIIKE